MFEHCLNYQVGNAVIASGVAVVVFDVERWVGVYHGRWHDFVSVTA